MQTPAWIDAYGRPIALATMTSEHIRNAMAYVRRGNGNYGPPNCGPGAATSLTRSGRG